MLYNNNIKTAWVHEICSQQNICISPNEANQVLVTVKHTAGVVRIKLFAEVPEVEKIIRHLKFVELDHLITLC